jgi:hypothetical protein
VGGGGGVEGCEGKNTSTTSFLKNWKILSAFSAASYI